MKQVKTVSVQVGFLDDTGKDISRAEVLVDTDVKHLRVEDLIDACQRAVANAVEELKARLEKQPNIR